MSKQYDGSKLEQSTNVERHMEVGHQRFFKMIPMTQLLIMRNVLENGL
jgi:hypothetical protein